MHLSCKQTPVRITQARSSYLNRFVFQIFCLGLAFIGVSISPRPLFAQANDEDNNLTPLCRFGVNATHGSSNSITDFDLSSLRVGWYIDYQANATAPRPNGIQYTPMIRLKQTSTNTYLYSPNGNTLKNVIAKNPGADWLIGNEPDRRMLQDDIEPALYARAYHDLYNLIKQLDPTAKILAGSIVQPTVVRLQYLDLVLKSYQAQFGAWMPVDAWSIHNFILNEASCDHYGDPQICWGADIPPGISATDGLRINVDDNDRFDLFVEQIVRFRQWMLSRGYRNVPLYLTEYGVLMPASYGFPESRVNTFMTKTFDYLLNTSDAATGYPADNNRLVQHLSWYSTNDSVAFNGYLFEPNPSQQNSFQLSLMGQNYANYTKNITDAVDIYPVSVSVTPAAPLTSQAPVTLTVSALIANSGNNLVPTTTTVRFYNGDPTQGGKQIGSDQVVTLAGCGTTANAKEVWKNVTVNTYDVYVVVDPSNQVNEPGSGEANNTRQQVVFFSTSSVYLPILSQMTVLQ